MSQPQSSSFPNRKPLFDDHQWIVQIRRTLEEELESELEVPVSIFNVPRLLMASDPESYTPQEVSIGPCHHWSPELYEMERYKLAAAKRFQKEFQGCKLDHVVDQLGHLEPRIRASYHKVLEIGCEALAWMMAIDASFLLEFLQIYAINEGTKMARISSRMLADYAGTKSTHNAILRDMVMLENQIPLMVLRKMLEVRHSTLDIADEMLATMLEGFAMELSPFKMMQDMPFINISQCSHLLVYIYSLIVPKVEAPQEINEADLQDQLGDSNEKDHDGSLTGESSYVKKLFSLLWDILSQINKGPILFVKKLIFSAPVKVILKLPWMIISNLPGISVLKQPIESMFFSNDQGGSNTDGGSSSKEASNKPPLIEEITIPSVSDLAKSGVRFRPTKGNLLSIKFDAKTATIYLPVATLDVNTEVVLRNLVAYEASDASGPLVLTRYTELMNGIIDTEEDAKLLRSQGIILNHLKTDKEVASLWNGMSKSIKLTKVPFLDKVIKDVNKHHNSWWKVKAAKFMKRYVFGSWQILTLLVCLMLLALMSLQAFCSVYTCGRMLSITATANPTN